MGWSYKVRVKQVVYKSGLATVEGPQQRTGARLQEGGSCTPADTRGGGGLCGAVVASQGVTPVAQPRDDALRLQGQLPVRLPVRQRVWES